MRDREQLGINPWKSPTCPMLTEKHHSKQGGIGPERKQQMRTEQNRTHAPVLMQVGTLLIKKPCLHRSGHDIPKAIKNEHGGLYVRKALSRYWRRKRDPPVSEEVTWPVPILVKKQDLSLSQSIYR